MGIHVDTPSRGQLGHGKPQNLFALVEEEAGDEETLLADEGMTW